jgi:hypothetical protein
MIEADQSGDPYLRFGQQAGRIPPDGTKQTHWAERELFKLCVLGHVVGPVHGALMVEGPADAIDDVVARTQEAMAEASAIVLGGFRLRSDPKIVRWPNRYMDGRGREFWGRVMSILPSESDLA